MVVIVETFKILLKDRKIAFLATLTGTKSNVVPIPALYRIGTWPLLDVHLVNNKLTIKKTNFAIHGRCRTNNAQREMLCSEGR